MFGDPSKEVVATYYDANKFEGQVVDLSEELTKEWVQYMGDTLEAVLRKLEKDDQKGAQKAFLKAIETAEMKGAEMATRIGQMLAEQVGETFQIAYNEGASAAQSLSAKTLRDLIKVGSIHDENGEIERFLQVAEKHHREYMERIMKGRNLNVYAVDKKEPKEDE